MEGEGIMISSLTWLVVTPEVTSVTSYIALVRTGHMTILITEALETIYSYSDQLDGEEKFS